MVAPVILLEGEGGERLASLMRDAGVEIDLPRALALEGARQPLRWADVNAVLMLHQEGAGEDEVRAYLMRWGLRTVQEADHLIRFFMEPSSRSYVVTYSAGRQLCGDYVAGDPKRLRYLLTEQVRVRDLLEPQA
jgi:hypothetical protein